MKKNVQAASIAVTVVLGLFIQPKTINIKVQDTYQIIYAL
jgi:hypothetical protein